MELKQRLLSWTIQLLLQPSVSYVTVFLLASGLLLNISGTFCDGFMVPCVMLMLSKFLHLWFLLFDCFICHQDVTSVKRFTRFMSKHYTGEMEDLIIGRLAIVF